MMVQSLQDVTMRAVESHSQLPHITWVMKWPSQVVLTVAQIVWTAEVEHAIRQGTLKVNQRWYYLVYFQFQVN